MKIADKSRPLLRATTIRIVLFTASVFATTLASAGAGASGSDEDGWTVSFGGGYGRTSLTESQTSKAQAFPIFDLNWQKDRWFAGLSSGLGYKLVKSDAFNLSTSLSYDPGRKESSSQRLRGLGNIAASPTVSIAIDFAPVEFISFNAGVTHAMKGSKGTLVNFGLGTGLPLGGKTSLYIAANGTYADRKHMQAYYGINARQATRSRFRAFTPKAGIESVDFSVGISHEFNKEWSLDASVGTQRLMGDAKKSPLTDKPNSPVATFVATYRF